MHLSRDVVLLISHSGDFFTIDRVAEALSRKGAQPFRLDTDKFPLKVQLTAHFDKSKSYHTIEYAGKGFRLAYCKCDRRRSCTNS